MEKTLIVITGPTGIGKTDLSIEIAEKLNTCIISADSRQIYKELKVGVARPSDEELARVKHYMIANKSIYDYYSAGKYEIEVTEILKKLFKTKNKVLLVGGSGMYIDAVCKGIDALPDADPEIRKYVTEKYEKEGIESLRFDLKRLDPQYYRTTDLNNPKRLMRAVEVCIQTGKTYTSFLSQNNKIRDFKIIKIALNRDREELYNRINKRVDFMIENGLINEAEKYKNDRHLNSLNTVGYKELFPYFDNKYDLTEAVRLIKRNTRRYAKRQITWIKKDKEYIPVNPEDKEKIFKIIV